MTIPDWLYDLRFSVWQQIWFAKCVFFGHQLERFDFGYPSHHNDPVYYCSHCYHDDFEFDVAEQDRPHTLPGLFNSVAMWWASNF